MRLNNKKSFTLAETLLAAFIMVIVGAVLVSMVASSSIALNRTKNSFVLSSHASSVFEHIKSLNRTQIIDKKDDQQYWLDLVDSGLQNRTISLNNVNAGDTDWDDDPLGVLLELGWELRGEKQSETYLTYFTF